MKTIKELQPLIIEWAKEKGINNSGRQYLKVLEEVGETAKAILQNDIDEIKDGIGDIAVTLIILYSLEDRNVFTANHILGSSVVDLEDMIEDLYFREPDILDTLGRIALRFNTNLEECLNIAWNEIKGRTGKTVNGTFIKDS
jgi:NTP pyrophosphatase (non-canonical NTP hydrolase)